MSTEDDTVESTEEYEESEDASADSSDEDSSDDDSSDEEDNSIVLELDDADLERYQLIFEEADVDGSESVSARELKEHMKKGGQDVNYADILLCLQKIDKDGDGTLDFPEFCLMMEEARKLRSETLRLGFKVLHDKNEGLIVEEKLKKKLRQIGAPLSDEQIADMVNVGEDIDFPMFCEIMDEEVSEVSEEEDESSYEEESDYEVGDEPTLGKIKLGVFGYYLQKKEVIKCKGEDTLKDFADMVAKEFNTVPHLMRFYHKGDSLRDFTLRLFDYGVAPSSTIVFITLPNPDPLPKSKFLLKDGYDSEAVYRWFEREGTLSPADALEVLTRATTLVDSEPNMLEVAPPCVVVTDIHGQFFDLKNMFEPGGFPGGDVKYVFAGDYGDRGYFSMEVIMYIAMAKLQWPDKVFMGRGNHETEGISIKYGTFWECMVKYGKEATKQLMRFFNALPVTTLISVDEEYGGHRFLCMHGGLTRNLTDVDDINEVSRNPDKLKKGELFYDMMWTDPDSTCELDDGGRTDAIVERTDWDLADIEELSEEATEVETEEAQEAFEGNGSRYSYKKEAIHYYLKKNNLLSLIRGHQTVREGLYYYEDGPEYAFPSVISIFSAPNYTDQSMQSGCVAHFTEDGELKLTRVGWSPHPIYRMHNPSKLEDLKKATYFIKDVLAEDIMQWSYHNDAELVWKTRMKEVVEKNADAFLCGAYPSAYAQWEKNVAKQGHEQADRVLEDQKNYNKTDTKKGSGKAAKSGKKGSKKGSKAKNSKKGSKAKDSKAKGSKTGSRRRGNRVKGGGPVILGGGAGGAAQKKAAKKGSAKGSKKGNAKKGSAKKGSAKKGSAKKGSAKGAKGGAKKGKELTAKEYGGGLGGFMLGGDGEEAGYSGINWKLVGKKQKKSTDWSAGVGEIDLDEEVMWSWKYVKKNLVKIIETSSRDVCQEFVARHKGAFAEWQDNLEDFSIFADTEEVTEDPSMEGGDDEEEA